MPPEERRAALVEATLPLLLEHGATVSTRQIAEAAGVAEGTIFRVFESKDDLVHACLHDALTNDALAEQLDALPRDLDLPDTRRAEYVAVAVLQADLLVTEDPELGRLAGAYVRTAGWAELAAALG